MKLENKRIYITGSNRGMGYAFAKEAAGRSMHLILCNRRPLSEEQIQELKNRGALSIEEKSLDLLDRDNVDHFLKELRSEQIDVFFNNAGLLTGGLLENQPIDDIERMLQVNLVEVIRMTRSILPQMLEANSGLIINNASVSGKMFFPCASTYAASKAGVVAFTESLNQELSSTGVQCLLLITPGVSTEMYEDIGRLYGENLDLSFMDSIPASAWAQKVFEAASHGEEILYPDGMSRLGLWLGHHTPKIFKRILKTKFSR